MFTSRLAALTVSSSLARDVKVLSFTGSGAGIEDVNWQHGCFEKDLIPGVQIRGTKSTKISAEILKGYDLLLMPGGSHGPYLRLDQDAIRSYVKAGGGFYGTCAGAYAGCTSITAEAGTGRTDPNDPSARVEPIGNDTYGMPIYPQEKGMGLSSAVCDYYSETVPRTNVFTAEGRKDFPNQEASVLIDHHNGPAMQPKQATTLATFSDGPFKGEASIVGNKYGAGNVILVSPHPEHSHLQNCDMVTYMAAYAAGVTGSLEAELEVV